jgi:hypothetical protein
MKNLLFRYAWGIPRVSRWEDVKEVQNELLAFAEFLEQLANEN